jgi:ectoine hydroxylase-related dioxygenase (phytanoyl-CoA dioxygenase family)
MLHDQGFVVLRDIIPVETIRSVEAELDERFHRTPFCKGAFYGERTKRFGKLLTRSPLSRALVMHQAVLELARATLLPFADTISLNLTQAVEIHPGAPLQAPHRDENMWGGAKGEMEYLINVIWPLSPFTKENGATVIYPNSHGGRETGESSVCELMPGSALVFLGSTLHGAGANISGGVRRALILSYCLGWLKPYENQWLCYPPSEARTFDPALADLVGYNIHRPNLGNVDGQCPSTLFDDKQPDYVAATDALAPDQEAALTAFREQQLMAFG